MLTLLFAIFSTSLSFATPTPPAVTVTRVVKSAPQLADLKNEIKDLRTYKINLDHASHLKNQPLGQQIVFAPDVIEGGEVLDWLRASPELEQKLAQSRALRVSFEKFFLKFKNFYVYEIESNQTTCTGSDYRFISDDFSTGIAMNLSGCN